VRCEGRKGGREEQNAFYYMMEHENRVPTLTVLPPAKLRTSHMIQPHIPRDVTSRYFTTKSLEGFLPSFLMDVIFAVFRYHGNHRFEWECSTAYKSSCASLLLI
jgi:hypothetical protein